ncbi:hypothetical protein ACPWT1_06700 [Ramlibacter sp. MMS24-I3-19]|uniref:hypothetical protein n=1 Tax=Ramlibacter sp. MMS24-I3-19 TaxID=3416606 RepID=UPI003D04675E
MPLRRHRAGDVGRRQLPHAGPLTGRGASRASAAKTTIATACIASHAMVCRRRQWPKRRCSTIAIGTTTNWLAWKPQWLCTCTRAAAAPTRTAIGTSTSPVNHRRWSGVMGEACAGSTPPRRRVAAHSTAANPPMVRMYLACMASTGTSRRGCGWWLAPASSDAIA